MSNSLQKDYDNFKTEIIKSTKVLFNIDRSIEPVFKKHHKSLYVIALIFIKLKRMNSDENRISFFAEIQSDILSITKLAYLGFEIPALILLRRVIENFYNHIYYTDHRIEYFHLNNGKNEYTPMNDLKNYLDSHPIFSKNQDTTIKEYNHSLYQVYQELCKVVHTKGIDSMNLSKNLKEITNVFDIKAFLNHLISIELYIIYITFKFHQSLSFTPIEKGIIIEIIPRSKRVKFTE